MKMSSKISKYLVAVTFIYMLIIVAGTLNVAAANDELKIAHHKSTDASGTEKNTFLLGDDVYCTIHVTGSGSLTIDIYIVFNDEWHGGGEMTDRGDGVETFLLSSSGPQETFGPFLIWDHTKMAGSLLVPGEYDIVLDENQNGIRDPGEAVDDSSVSPGFFVIPEIQGGTLMAIAAPIAAIGVIRRRKIKSLIKL